MGAGSHQMLSYAERPGASVKGSIAVAEFEINAGRDETEQVMNWPFIRTDRELCPLGG